MRFRVKEMRFPEREKSIYVIEYRSFLFWHTMLYYSRSDWERCKMDCEWLDRSDWYVNKKDWVVFYDRKKALDVARWLERYWKNNEKVVVAYYYPFESMDLT